MATITIEEMRRDVTGYLRRASTGETFVVVEADTPIAEIKPVAKSSASPRPFGLAKGRFVVPDDFDDPLPENVIRSFEQS